MKRETFLNYRNWYFAKLSIVILSILALLYFIDAPLGGRRGNTIVGLTLGVLATLGILYLTYFGIKKRCYATSSGNLVATLSAHVWLGLSLLLIVPLHCGFHLGLNVHSLTYLLMIVVIVSGIFGAITYRVLPQRLYSQRGAEKPEEFISIIQDLDAGILALADLNEELKKIVRQLDVNTDYYLRANFSLSRPKPIDEKKAADLVSALPADLNNNAINLLNLLAKKRGILIKFTEEVRASAMLKIWLFLHIPFTCLLLIVLFIHIYLVFYYWT